MRCIDENAAQNFPMFVMHKSKGSPLLVLGVVVCTIFFSSLPYLFGWLVAGKDSTYLAMNPIGPADTNVYFSFMRQVEDGSVFVKNLHTSEPQVGSIFHPLWVVLGLVGGISHVPIPVVFHVSRALLGAGLLLFLYRFLGEIFSDERKKNIAFVLIALSSGVGWVLSLQASIYSSVTALYLQLPSDQWISESNTFLTLMHSPLFILSQFLLVSIFWCFIAEDRFKNFLFPASLVGLLAIVHPYDLVTIGVILPAFLLVRIIRDGSLQPHDALRYLRRCALSALFAVPPILALYVASHIEPAIGGWAKQNITISPPPSSYILGYGFLLLFAVVGWTAMRKTTNRFLLFLMTWAATSCILLYIPIQINRRMSNGLHIALSILAAVGIDVLWRYLQTLLRKHPLRQHALLSVVGWVLCLGLFFSTGVTVIRSLYWESNPKASLYHISKSVAQAMDWLGTHTPRDAVILSTGYNGNVIPARSGRAVFLGHGHQTIHNDRKATLVNKWFFWRNTDDVAKYAFLRRGGIDYLFFSPAEASLGQFQPQTKNYLTLVYESGTTRVYRVNL